MFVENLLNLSGTIKDCERRIIDLILSLDKKIIDDRKSSLKESSEYITIDLVSIDNLNCPFQIQIGKAANRYKLNLALGRNAEVYSLEDFSTQEDCKDILQDLNLYLSSHISEEVYLVNNSPAKAIYHVLNANVAGLKDMVFTKYYRSIWFWMKKEVITKSYVPWISK